jgi:paraquat-inducible protein B
MAEDPDLPDVPVSEVAPGKRHRVSAVWIVPILAALVGIGIAVRQQMNEGPTIRIHFRSAEGVEAGKTSVKYKDIEIGKVEAVTLSEDYSHIVVTAKIEKSAEKLIVEGTRFWVVKPRVSLSGVSGIGTLLSGNYIRMEPGTSGRPGRVFTGLETPPPVTSDVPGRVFLLRADTLGSLGAGSPVYYRRLNVGQVISYALADDGKSVIIRIFLNAPFDRFVTPNTRFWEASGIDVTAGADGFTLRSESLLALLVGGIAFETPPSEGGDNTAVADNAVFPLSADRVTALSPREVSADRYTLYFSDSLRGLSVGAPVSFLGLPVGEVTDIYLEYVPGTQTLRTRVETAIYLHRFFTHLQKPEAVPAKNVPLKTRQQLMDRQVADKGLRAQLRSGSFVSGQLYVALDFFPNAPKAEIDWTRKPPCFPTVPAELTELQAMAKRLLAKLDKVPVEEIGNETRQAIVDLDRTLRRLEGQTLPGAERAFASVDRTMSRVDAEIVPDARRTLEELRKAAASAERALADADRHLLSADAPARLALVDALRETARAARSIRLLADYLERNPSALIRGKSQEKHQKR